MSCGHRSGRRGKARERQEDSSAHSQGPCPTDVACAKTQGKRTLARLEECSVATPSLQGHGEPGLKNVPWGASRAEPELHGTDLVSPPAPQPWGCRGGVRVHPFSTRLREADGKTLCYSKKNVPRGL